MSAQLAFKMKMAKQVAEKLLRDEGMLEAMPIDPTAIANTRNILVQAKPDTAPGVSGMLLRYGESYGIYYATHIPVEGYQRFSIAHELGHYFLDGHLDQVLKDDVHSSHAGFVSGDPFELEADAFAAGLLMPASPMKKLLRLNDPGLATIEKAAERFSTSLTATAIRFAELTEDAVAVIVSTGPNIDYCFLSDAMKSLPKLDWLKRGSPVPPNTSTHSFNSDPSNIRAAKRTKGDLDVREWLGGTTKAMISEEVIGLGSYGKTLTVLSSSTIGSDDEPDEDDDERIEESWTPRFRR